MAGTLFCLIALVWDMKSKMCNARPSAPLTDDWHVVAHWDNTFELLWASPPGKNAREIQWLLNYNPITYFIHHLMLFDYLNRISFYNSKCFHEDIMLPWSPSVRKPFHWNLLQWSSLGFSSGQCGSSLQSLIEKTWSKPRMLSSLLPSVLILIAFHLSPC